MSSFSAFSHAPSFFSLFTSSRSSSLAKPSSGCSSMKPSVRIAVVGDVHDYWDLEEDTKALQFLQPDLVLFTGDFGNENVELVQSIADLKFPKAVILGNHDSWTTQKFSSMTKDRVQLQLECLGEEHVGYKRLDFPALKLSVVGGRPFSCGGVQLFRKQLLSARYGVKSMDESGTRIYNAALRSPEDHLIIFLAHNGPTGLGSNLDDICGKDWVFEGGDHGDPDLAKALSLLKQTANLSVPPLVIFGHMHKELAYGKGLRKMIVVGDDKTIYLNGAVVPRVQSLSDEQATSDRSFTDGETAPIAESKGTLREFTVVEILDGKVEKIAETWVSVAGEETALARELIQFKSSN